MSIVKRAVKESRDVARLAVDAAHHELIEQLAPAIKRIIDKQMRMGVLEEDVAALHSDGVDRMRQKAGGYDGISDFEEGKDMKDKKKDKMESVAALFPGVTEVAESDDVTEGGDNPKDDSGYDDIGEGADEDPTEGLDEELELSESELEAMYAEALQLEVDVTKGFRDMAKPHDLGAGAKGQYQSDGANLADYKSGEAEWDNIVPPDKKDFIPEKRDFTKNEIRKLVRRGMAENRALAEQNGKLTEMVRALHGKLSETNLLNSKILHVNKFMTNHRLTAEQKKSVIESIDKGSSVNEVKRIFSILESSFRAAGAVSEGVRRPRADSQKVRSSGNTSQVLRESADNDGGAIGAVRWQQLAGLKKITSGR